MRGMLANADQADILRLIAKIHDTCSVAEFKTALDIIRASDIFKGNPIGREFNKSFPKLLQSEADYGPEEIVAKVWQHRPKMLDLIALTQCAFEAIAEFDLAKALSQCKALVAAEGVSICLLRILYFIRNHSINNPAQVKEIEQILIEIKTDNVRYLSLAIKELSSEKTDYFNISEKINNADDSIVISIAKHFIDHIPRNADTFVKTLNAYYRISVFDAYLYLCSIQRLDLPFALPLQVELVDQYTRLTATEIDPTPYYSTSDEYVGLDFFRETFLLLEANNFFAYRTVHAAIFNPIEAKEDRRIPLERSLLHSYFHGAKNISSIGSQSKLYVLSHGNYVRANACHFQNSTALVYVLERNDGRVNEEEIDFVKLMSLTRDIGIICPIQYIENIKLNAATDELKVVATCLSHIKQKSQLIEHELRAVIQSITINNFGAKLTELLGYIFNISPAVAEHLIQTSDETFLSKLFQLIKNPNAAIEERASILEWYGNKVGDSSFLERAKNLRIDVQINKEKGTIDDSRIYVDPVKFTQWINNQVLDNLTILLESLPSHVDPGVVAISWDKVKTGITVHDQLGSLLLICYEEFSSNKIFGIASYLGRRIRHGTLKGTGLSDVTHFAMEAKFRKLFLNREFEDAFKAWLKEYEGSLDQLRDHYLHIQDKSKEKPDGMIMRDFRSHNKRTAANHMLYDVIKSFDTNKSGVELPYIILEYCWRLIEEDLFTIRKFLMEKKAKYAVFRFESTHDTSLKQREVQEFCQELNSLTAEKFRMISSWFNKPSIASPSANITLLFKAVVSEIKGFFTYYSPSISVNEEDFTISGGAYFVIYDALYILIYNAAKYGKCDGILSMTISIEKSSNKASINILITSQITGEANMEDIKYSIYSALEGDCEDALVIEGRSGIKKLRRMEQDSYIGGVKYEFGCDSIHASFNFGADY